MTPAPSVPRELPHELPARRPYRTWQAVALRWIVLAVMLVLVARSEPTWPVVVMMAIASAAWVYWSWFDVAERPSTMAAALVFGLAGASLAGSHGTPNNGGIAFACAASLFLASNLRYLTGVLLTLAIMATVSVAGLATGHSWELGINSIVAVGWAIGNGRRSRNLRIEQTEALLAETIRANAGQAEAGALAERARIAREIHDVLAHSLSALTLQLDAADALLTDGRDPARAHEMVVRAQRTARDGLDESRRAVSALRDDVKPLSELVGGLVDDFRMDTGTDAALMITGDPTTVPVEVAQSVQRLVRESLTNVRKHAPGASVTVRLDVGRDGAIRTTVEDSGGAASDRTSEQAPDQAPDQASKRKPGGYGLVGLRERIELLGGTITAGPQEDGSGWAVRASVPSMTD